MRYLNLNNYSRSFYGVEFHPYEEHDVPGYINADGFFRVADVSKEPPKIDKQLPKDVTVKKLEKSKTKLKSKQEEK